MALPQHTKRGLRLLKHQNIDYYWKVRERPADAMLEVIVGISGKPSVFFKIRLSYINRAVYFPWLGICREQGKETDDPNRPDHIGPGFITEAITYASRQNWPAKKNLLLHYEAGLFRQQD